MYYDFFLKEVFFHEHSQFTGLQRKGEATSLTFLYSFHPFHRQKNPDDGCREITVVHDWQAGPNRVTLITKLKLLPTKLHAPHSDYASMDLKQNLIFITSY